MKRIISICSLVLILMAVPVFAATTGGVRLAETEDQLQARQQEMTELKAKIAETKAANQAAKEQLRLQSAEKAKTIAVKRLSNMINVFNNLKKMVGNLPNLTAAEKTEIQGKIDAETAKLEAKKTEVQSASTVAEIKAIMVTAKVQAKESMVAIKVAIREARSANLHKISDHLSAILTRLTTKAGAMTLTDAQKAELAAIEATAKADIAKVEADITANNFTQAKLDAATVRTDLLSYIAKLKSFKTTTDTE